MNRAGYESLAQSEEAREDLAAFHGAAGLSVQLVPANPQASPSQIGSRSNPFCVLIRKTSGGKAACRCVAEKLHGRLLRKKTGPMQCFTSLTELAAPIRVEGRLVAMLVCGQVFRRKQTRREYARAIRRLQRLGITLDRKLATRAWSQIGVARNGQLDAVARLLEILAKRFAERAAHKMSGNPEGEPQFVRRAKEFVEAHLAESVTLRKVAHRTHVSPQHFCRVFKRATKMTFTEYVTRLRVANAKQLLADSSRRVSDVAFAAGFGSIPHFNRAFKRYAGTSPRGYRASLRA